MRFAEKQSNLLGTIRYHLIPSGLWLSRSASTLTWTQL